jgi:hypothetical protein
MGLGFHALYSSRAKLGFFLPRRSDSPSKPEHYFWSFYLLDADMAIAILLSLIASPCIVFATAGAVRGKMWLIWSVLLVVALMFANDARLLRHEIKALLDAEPK